MGSSLFPTATWRRPSTATVTDMELVERARRHDDEAWAELVHRHHVTVYRTAFAALLRAEDAEDAAQEAWVAAWQRLDGFRGNASFKTWVTSVAWRKALDRRRAVMSWVRRLAFAPHDDEGGFDAGQLPDVATPGPERLLLGREERTRVRRALQGLPKAQRDCLMLAAGGALTYDEIAAVLGIPVGTVKWRVSEARKRLRTRMEGLRS
jgi:RNA polymerase sigma-70 factor (ECF subfamily)